MNRVTNVLRTILFSLLFALPLLTGGTAFAQSMYQYGMYYGNDGSMMGGNYYGTGDWNNYGGYPYQYYDYYTPSSYSYYYSYPYQYYDQYQYYPYSYDSYQYYYPYDYNYGYYNYYGNGGYGNGNGYGNGGGYGAHCGGFIQNAPTCAQGYYCKLSQQTPDTGGTCMPNGY